MKKWEELSQRKKAKVARLFSEALRTTSQSWDAKNRLEEEVEMVGLGVDEDALSSRIDDVVAGGGDGDLGVDEVGRLLEELMEEAEG